MNFNKLGMAVLSVGAIFMATSCNKTQTINLEKATEWVEEHGKKEPYVKTNPKSGSITLNFAATTGKMRDNLKEAMELDESMRATETMPQQSLSTVSYLDSVTFKQTYTEETVKSYNTVFTLTGDSLSIKTDYSEFLQQMAFSSGEAIVKQNYDSSARPTKTVITLKNASMDGVDGKANGTMTTTYKY